VPGYFIVSVDEGVLDIDYKYLLEGVQTTSENCHVKLQDGVTVRGSWTEITEAEFISARESLLNPE